MFREEEGKRDVWRIDDTGSISGSDRSALLVTGTSGLRRSTPEDEEGKSTENREDSSDQSCGKAG